MNFTPQLSEVRAIAAEKKYDVVPISCEILSDICTPIEAIPASPSVLPTKRMAASLCAAAQAL